MEMQENKPIPKEVADFFKVQTPSSRVKANLISQYFPQYCRIISKNVVQNTIWYMDLFAGPGKYGDGNLSTPLLVAELCLKDQLLQSTVRLIFNDLIYKDELELNFNSHIQANGFRYKPQFRKFDMEEDGPIIKHLKKVPKAKERNPNPTVLFFDPFGYKPVDTVVLANFLQHWGNELFLFVNIKRITAALDNPKFYDNMQRMFPSQFDNLQKEKVKYPHPYQRTSIIIKTLIAEFKCALGDSLYASAFKFMEEDSSGASHFILHFTKHSRGYELVKQIFYDYDNIGSTLDDDGTYTFDAKAMYRNETASQLFGTHDLNITTLSNDLLAKYKGKTVTARNLFDSHQITNKYCASQYKDALRKLVDEGKITATFTDNSNHVVSVLITDKCTIKFL